MNSAVERAEKVGALASCVSHLRTAIDHVPELGDPFTFLKSNEQSRDAIAILFALGMTAESIVLAVDRTSKFGVADTRALLGCFVSRELRQIVDQTLTSEHKYE